MNEPCGNTVKCGVDSVFCSRPKGHQVVGFNNGRTRRYEFHHGDGWVWDERCGWCEGQEPK